MTLGAQVERERVPKCSVVIPTCNEGELLAMTVASVLADSAYPHLEVVVVDDGSTDGSTEPLAHIDDRVRLLRGELLGLSRARNWGAEEATGDVLVFLDAHCRVFAGWLSELVSALAAPDVALVGPAFRLLESDERRGCGMTWVNDQLDTAWFELTEVSEQFEVPLLPGGCQAFRAETFTQLGRYDEGMTRWGFEDIEISVRAWLLGYRILGVPAALVAHHFREERVFDVTQEGILYNYLRLLYLHFSPRRIAHLLAAMGSETELGRVLRALMQSDILELRRELEAVRPRDDDWFFATFAPTLPVANPQGAWPHAA
jgi:GT2 family glycosyltransferase